MGKTLYGGKKGPQEGDKNKKWGCVGAKKDDWRYVNWVSKQDLWNDLRDFYWDVGSLHYFTWSQNPPEVDEARQ